MSPKIYDTEYNITMMKNYMITIMTCFDRVLINTYCKYYCSNGGGACGGVVVKALRYKTEGPGIDPQWCHWGFFPWHPTIPCARGRLSLLK
jgi:hypothetical protein